MERKFMVYCDQSAHILGNYLKKYLCHMYLQLIEGDISIIQISISNIKQRRKIKKSLIEIKPKKQTQKPTNKKTKSYITESKTWVVNQAKWDCSRRVL